MGREREEEEELEKDNYVLTDQSNAQSLFDNHMGLVQDGNNG